MKFLLVMGATFVIINISFLFLQLGHHSTGPACNCARERNVVKESVSSTEASKVVDLKLSLSYASSLTAPKPPAKPVFNEVIKPNYNDRVKPKKYDDAIKAVPATTLEIPVIQGYFWNETYQPVKLYSNNHKLAVVVPFRNRYEEMLEFVPHMHRFLTKQNVSHDIWIINQADTHRYGRDMSVGN